MQKLFTDSRPLSFAKLIALVLFLFVFEPVNAVAPVAGFSVNNSSVCTGATVLFTNTSTGSITTYFWNFGAGATPSTATTAGPHNVTYTTTGAKSVSLTVSGVDGNNTITKTNFITVGFDRIKVLSANLLNYPDNANPTGDTTARHPYFRTVFGATLPDILVAEEVNSQDGINWYLARVLNTVSSGYAAGTFINGADTDNGIFYKTAKFSFHGNTRIKTALRDINEFKLVHLLTGDTLRVYAVHLKASTGAAEEAQRAKEVDSLRKVTDVLPLGSNFIVCGDFNIYKTSESAYQKLIAVNPANEGHVVDPLPLTGTWNNGAFAIYHTQSTRTRAFNNGSTGGLNDRFDMMLFSKAVNLNGGISYVANSTVAFGNDGNHYNDSINQPPNTAVSQSMADAIYNASDHLPLYASFDFQLTNCVQSDMGTLALINPPSSLCGNANQTLQVQIKNFATNAIDFSITNASVILTVVDPLSVTKTFTKIITNGTLAPGSTLVVAFDSSYNMTTSGSYTFNAITSINSDGNTANDAMPASITTVNQNVATISPAGSLFVCQGDSIILTASSGTQYSWSTGATTATITVADTGSYSVSVTNSNGCVASSNIVHIAYNYFSISGIVFNEMMGSVSGTTTLATHETNNGFDNDNFTMSGSADVRNTQTSSGTYATSSGGANVFITNTVGKNFIISGISTMGYGNLTLNFGIYKSTTTATGADLLLQLSTDGVNYNSISFPSLPSGAGWYYVNVNGVPSTQILSIQFKQNGIVTQYRIDDLSLTYSNDVPSITTTGATTFCMGDSVLLQASTAASYLWSNGLTSQNIYSKATGNYSVVASSPNGCTANVPPVAITSNYCNFNIATKVFIEGFYVGNGIMQAVVDPINYPLVCDTVEMKLAMPIPPYSILYTDTTVLFTDGTATFNFNTLPIYDSYYLVLKHRNAIETWSKIPFVIQSSNLFQY